MGFNHQTPPGYATGSTAVKLVFTINFQMGWNSPANLCMVLDIE